MKSLYKKKIVYIYRYRSLWLLYQYNTFVYRRSSVYANSIKLILNIKFTLE